ncbi:GNAT family N-acetyltransferase [Luteipulveratus sp. YIM 133132]|uniref:GNAT family N-acetyltransferase n=1 Tax=Luteipulveratus flavus TaxID=3031728 RepID=A0ABT6C802_9MICO|nr:MULTISPECIES: GNAT family N-acetyltransferase [unclassified Luteipulveratus]MDE9365002.1 GNAT family N-acetyltransferase [Luteipulveratus sp. YIM 133132]MDF8264658.1 GNAT family N-acetyltransferase [Luteipulveratus sp. YIM 133296]
MTAITVRALGDGDWQVYRDIRLEALKESPDAFAASADQEQGFDEDLWRKRVTRSRRLVAEQDGAPVGVVSVGSVDEQERVVQLFGLWVSPQLRGQGVAWKLVEAGVENARQDEQKYVLYWVGTDNGRAVAFASSFGFRPTDSRRPMREQDASDDEDDDNLEMAMVFPLGSDPGAVPSSVLS